MVTEIIEAQKPVKESELINLLEVVRGFQRTFSMLAPYLKFEAPAKPGVEPINVQKLLGQLNFYENELKKLTTDDKAIGDMSDGYHTFNELYEHRCTLFMALCKGINLKNTISKPCWRSKLHSDGTSYDGWFILGYGIAPGEQITYHLPAEKWDECDFAFDFDRAPKYDGHTSSDVLERLKRL